LKVYTSVIRQPVESLGPEEKKSEQKVKVEKQKEDLTQEPKTTAIQEVLTELKAPIAEAQEAAETASVQEQQTAQVKQPALVAESQVAQLSEIRTPVEIAIAQKLQTVLKAVQQFPVSERTRVIEAYSALSLLSEDLAVHQILSEVLNETSVNVEATIIKEIEILSSTQEIQFESASSNLQEISSATTSSESAQESIKNIQPEVTFSSLVEARQNTYEPIEIATNQPSQTLSQRIIDAPSVSSSISQEQLIQNRDNVTTTSEVNQNTELLAPGDKYRAFRDEMFSNTNSDDNLIFTPLEALAPKTNFQPLDFQPPVPVFKSSQSIFSTTFQPRTPAQENPTTDPTKFDFRSLGNIEIAPPSPSQTIFAEPKTAEVFNSFSKFEASTINFAPAATNQYQVTPQAQELRNDFRSFSPNAFVSPKVNPEASAEPTIQPTSFNLLPQANFEPPVAQVENNLTYPEATQPMEFVTPIQSFVPPFEAPQLPSTAANNIVSFSRKAGPAIIEDNSGGDSGTGATAKIESAPALAAV